MNYENMREQVDFDNIRREKILTGKGREYTNDIDALSNFKQNGERLGLHPVQVLAIYMMKHVNSIETYLRQFNGQTTPEGIIDSSEGITGRIDDAINYLELLQLLLRDFGISNMADNGTAS